MNVHWAFKQATPGDRARETLVEKFFNSDAVVNRANAIVREGIQNSLDAAPESASVRVRIRLGAWSASEKAQRLSRYSAGLFDHLKADEVAKKLTGAPVEGDAFRYLAFEDFGTTGLAGDPAQWWIEEHAEPNPFFNYFRAEGISDKLGGKRGRHGVGRLVFMFASRAHAMLGLTQRIDGPCLLMGTTVLRNHRVGSKPYLPDGWFGVPSTTEAGLTLPVEDSEFLAQFRNDFALSRGEGQCGLSVVVPWLSEDVTLSEIIRGVVRGYFHPILRKKLVVEIVGNLGELIVIDDQSLSAVSAAQEGDFPSAMKPVLELAQASVSTPCSEYLPFAEPQQGAPKWTSELIVAPVLSVISAKLDAGEVVPIRVPVLCQYKASKKAAGHSYFDVFLTRDAAASDGQVLFIREGILISDVRPRRTSSVRALVIIDDGPLAEFLGDAENPSHTQWQKELVREKYSFHTATLDYVVQSVPSILRLLSEQQKKPDTSLLLDLFSIPSLDQEERVTKQKEKSKKPGTEDEEDTIDVPKTPKPFRIVKSADGFAIRPGDPDAARPRVMEVKVAYGVRRGSPFAKYNPADFRLGLGGVECHFKGCESVDFEANWIRIRITEADFEFAVGGFDTNRDLHVETKVKEVAEPQASANEEPEYAKAV